MGIGGQQQIGQPRGCQAKRRTGRDIRRVMPGARDLHPRHQRGGGPGGQGQGRHVAGQDARHRHRTRRMARRERGVVPVPHLARLEGIVAVPHDVFGADAAQAVLDLPLEGIGQHMRGHHPHPGSGQIGAPGGQAARDHRAADRAQRDLVGQFAGRAKGPDQGVMAMPGSQGGGLDIHPLQPFGLGGRVVGGIGAQ